MQYHIINKGNVDLLIDFIDGSERILHPNQYVAYNGPAEITKIGKRGLLNVWKVDSIEVTQNLLKSIDKERGPVAWINEGF